MKTFQEMREKVTRRARRRRERAAVRRLVRDGAGRGERTILIVDRYLPKYDEDAGSRSIWQYACFFVKQGFHVIFFGTDDTRHEPYATELEAMGVLVLADPYFERGIHAWLEDNAALIDYVIINRMHVVNRYFRILKDAIKGAVFAYMVSDLVFLRESRDEANVDRPDLERHIEILRSADLAYMREFDYTYVFSDYERDLILDLDPTIEVKQLPVYVFEDAKLFAVDSAPDPVTTACQDGFLFVGGFGHKPNVDATKWLAAEIAPRIAALLPGARITVVGGYPEEVIARLSPAPVSFTGRISDTDLDRLYRASRICLVPLRFGAGVKGKVIEAMHYGLPVVTTSIGAEGISGAADVLTVRDDADTFAEAACLLYQDAAGRKTQTERQRTLLASFFSVSSLTRILAADFGLAGSADGAGGAAADETLAPFVRALLVPRAEQMRLVFPEVSNPEVSILIPVHNKFDFTYACLKSVLDTCGGISYEVIVADDASTDKTAGLSHIVHGVTIVRNETPLLFLRNCNHAAKTVRGQYLVFLNNDTIVKPGWLAAMLGCVKSSEDIGVVGSKLLFADGRLQEAGGIIWTDGTGFNYGREKEPEDPAFADRREVDYVSGCSLLVRRELWEAVGGFDERFAPAYYEDTDLCFEARRRGYRVMVEPESVLVHFEGVSNGRDLSAGVKAHQEKNRAVFAEKWRDVLETEQFAPCTEFAKASDRGWRRDEPV